MPTWLHILINIPPNSTPCLQKSLLHLFHTLLFWIKVSSSLFVCLITQSCLTLCDTIDCSPQGSSVHGDSSGKNTGVGCHALLLQGTFPTQGSNPGLPHCRRILYCLSQQGRAAGTCMSVRTRSFPAASSMSPSCHLEPPTLRVLPALSTRKSVEF